MKARKLTRKEEARMREDVVPKVYSSTTLVSQVGDFSKLLTTALASDKVRDLLRG